MNMEGREAKNRASICELMEEAYDEGRLLLATIGDSEDEVYVLINEEQDGVQAALDKKTGEFLNTQAGKRKSNKRQYVNIPLSTNGSYMCANYTFRVIAEGLISGDPEHEKRYEEFKEGRYVYRLLTREEHKREGYSYKEKMMGPCYDSTDINHINGNSLDNRDDNLEVDTKAMNMAHARFMAEVHHYYPELVSEETDCQDNKMHQWVDGVGVSCQQIRAWNSANPNDVIRAFKDKKGTWTSHLTEEQVTKMLQFFGKM